MDEIEDIKRRLLALESPTVSVSKSKSDKSDKPIKSKSERKPTEYQVHMSNRLKELKADAASKGVQFDRRSAFGQAAKEWTSKKGKSQE